MIFTFWISAFFAVGSPISSPVYSIENGSVMHIDYSDQWFGKYNFLNSNADAKICKVVLHRASNKKLEDLVTDDRLDLAITYYTYSRTVEAPHRQSLKLVFKDGWVDCRFNQTAIVSLDDIKRAFSTANVTFTLADASTSNYPILETLSNLQLQVDTSNGPSIGSKNCFFTEHTSNSKLHNLHLYSYFYSSLKNSVGITYVSNELVSEEHSKLMLYCDDSIEEVLKTVLPISL